MILRELHEYYGRLLEDPDADVPPLHWSSEKAAWELGLNADGTLAYAYPLTTGEGKGARSFIQMRVPEHPPRSGSGLNPFFLCDNVAYLLGIDEKRGGEKRASSADLHRGVLGECDDAGARALLRFFEHADPMQGLRDEVKEALSESGGFAVFRFDGDERLLHERPAIASAWAKHCARPSEDDIVGQCSITGEKGALARLFPQVTGLPGAQSAGASLVSFNQSAFDSYGKSQAFNAAISQEVAFNAGSALKHLFADPNRRIKCGELIIIFWADRPAPVEDAVVRAMMGRMPDIQDGQPAEDEKTASDVGYALWRMMRGLPITECNTEVRYFVLGIAPNAARLSVQFFEESSFGDLERHFSEYLQDIALEGVKPRSLFTLLKQTAVRGNADDIPAPLMNACMRAMLTGSRFPRALLGSLLTRMRADRGSVNVWDMGQRAALIKAYLARDKRKKTERLGTQEEGSLQMSLERERADRGYVLGRLFAVMERAQMAAVGDPNATIKDRYIGSAASTPKRVFPMLFRNMEHHVAKLRKSSPGLCVFLDKEMDEIMELIDGEAFPASLDMDEQGAFYVGYHLERGYLWKTREERESKDACLEVVVELEA